MKRTLQLLSGALVLFLVAPAFAQDAKKPTTPGDTATPFAIGPQTTTVKAGKSATITYNGKAFKTLKLKADSTKLKYNLFRGSEFLSSGHTTGVISVHSDGKSTYTLQLTNPTKKTVTTVIVAGEGGTTI